MDLRPMGPEDLPRAADYLDARTLVLRWLVAFLRHRDLLPEEESSSWSFWCGEELDESQPGGGGELSCVLAHFFPSGTLYVGGGPRPDFDALEILCDENLLPERIVGDLDLMEGWRAASPLLFAKAVRVSETEVLEFRGAGAVPGGFRVAGPDDLLILRAYEDLLRRELGEEVGTDVESLLEAGLLHVYEEDGRVRGMIRSNLSDGKYVHAGGVFVHPLYRGKGVGRILAAGLGAWVRGKDGATVILDVYRENLRALAAYEAAGYVLVGSGLTAWFPEGTWGG